MHNLSGPVPWYARHDVANNGNATIRHNAVSITECDVVRDSSQLNGQARGQDARKRSLRKETSTNRQKEKKSKKRQKRCSGDCTSPPPSPALKHHKSDNGKGELSSSFAALRAERIAREKAEAERARAIMHQHFAS